MKTFLDAYHRLLTWVLALAVAVLIIPVSIQIFSRFTSLIPAYIWTEEMSRFFFIWMVLATQLFKDGKWIKYLWIFAMVMGLIWLGGLLDAATAIQLMEPVYRYGQWVCIAVLIVQAIQARHQLKLGSEILLFVLLLLFMLMPYPSGSQLFKPFISPFGLGEISMVNLLMLIRTSVPLAILLLTAWTYDLLVSQRVTKINSQLTATRVALDKESARLKQQKQFIAMLTHELKTP
jgi:signal transduction histidine kinase